MKKIKKLLNVILEMESKVKTPILINPTLNEIKKKLYEAKRIHGHNPTSLRFILWRVNNFSGVEDGYYIADADEWIHRDIKKEMNLPPTTSYIYGEFGDDGYLWFYRYMLYDYFNITNPDRVFHTPEQIIDLFKKTDLYKVIKPLINKIEYE